MAVMVTGAAGFIAFHLIESLLRDGIEVLGIDNFDPFYERSVKDKNISDLGVISAACGARFDFKELDLNDISASLFSGDKIDAVIHLAAKAGVRPSIEQPEAYLRANVNGTLRLLEYCRTRGISDFLFGSSSSVYGNDTPVPFSENARADKPISPYAASKRAGELYCYDYAHLYGIKVAALRFFTVYGAKQRPDLAIHKFTKLISQGKTITLYGDGSTARDYTFVTDIIGGVRGAMKWVKQAPGGTFEILNLGGSASTTLKKLISMIESNLGVPAKIRWESMQPGDVERTFADVSKSREFLGYEPKVPIETGIKLFMEWFKNADAA